MLHSFCLVTLHLMSNNSVEGFYSLPNFRTGKMLLIKQITNKQITTIQENSSQQDVSEMMKVICETRLSVASIYV